VADAVTLALTGAHLAPLAPVLDALDTVRDGRAEFGIADDLRAGADWVPASALVDGTALPRLLSVPITQWDAKPHAAAALAYKQYTYWLAMPAVLGWATARRVPLLSADNVAVEFLDDTPYFRLGMLRPTVAVLADDPAAGRPGTVVVDSADELLAVLADTLRDRHVAPLIEATRRHVRIGAHTLWGQLAASVGYALAAAEPVLDGAAADAQALLSALRLTNLAELCDTGDSLRVRRNTCCLAFVVPGLGNRLCPDCCITRPTT
jgi:ferric iron reductase protein FhuF